MLKELVRMVGSWIQNRWISHRNYDQVPWLETSLGAGDSLVNGDVVKLSQKGEKSE
jgi:hypothetical protein